MIHCWPILTYSPDPILRIILEASLAEAPQSPHLGHQIRRTRAYSAATPGATPLVRAISKFLLLLVKTGKTPVC